jgi:hypothetical protein
MMTGCGPYIVIRPRPLLLRYAILYYTMGEDEDVRRRPFVDRHAARVMLSACGEGGMAGRRVPILRATREKKTEEEGIMSPSQYYLNQFLLRVHTLVHESVCREKSSKGAM